MVTSYVELHVPLASRVVILCMCLYAQVCITKSDKNYVGDDFYLIVRWVDEMYSQCVDKQCSA